MSGILVLVFYMLLQREDAFKGQKTKLGMKKSTVSLLTAQPVWAVTCCQAAAALHSIKYTFTHLILSPFSLEQAKSFGGRKILEQALAFKLTKC